MTKEEQCIEIAKLCGWEFKQCSDGAGPIWHRPDGSVDLNGNIPRYAYDLNAMHGAENKLDDVGCYVFKLYSIVVPPPFDEIIPRHEENFAMIHASAARAPRHSCGQSESGKD